MISKFGTFEFALADRYRFEEELGRGAMGVVYRAQDVRLGRPVAIKMLHPLLTNEHGAQRFKSEIRIAAGLHHGNIIGLHESGEADGRLFYVMDYIGGETLRSRLIREKQLPVEDALQITEQIAAALQHAHDQGVVHRDVKPENIILAQGRACLMDFGLARAFGEGVGSERLTASGFSVGTPHYFSPEQASGEREVGPKSDQYSLACVLYEMLAGEPPFTGPNAAAIAMRHVSQDAAPIRMRRKTATAGVEAAISRAMEKVPGDRYSSISTFVLALRESDANAARVIKQTAKRAPRARSMFVAPLVVASLIGVLVAIAFSVRNRSAVVDKTLRTLSRSPLDSSKFLLIVRSVDGMDAPERTRTIAEALRHWEGVEVVSQADVVNALKLAPASGPDLERLLIAARASNAGRLLLGTLTGSKEGQVLDADVIDVASETHSLRVNVPWSSAVPTLIAFRSLFPLADSILYEEVSHGTSSRRAMAAFIAGRQQLSDWSLRDADSSFSHSLGFDSKFSPSRLELARVRSWQSSSSTDAQDLVDRALVDSDRLTVNDLLHARALSQLLKSRFREACAMYDTLSVRNPRDMRAWFGMSECNRLDSRVVRRPNGVLEFRGSARLAQESLDRGWSLLGSISASSADLANEWIRRVYRFTSGTEVRVGTGDGTETTLFGAYAALDHDTLVFRPVPLKSLTGGPPPTHARAVQLQRKLFALSAIRRTTRQPNDPYSLELLSDAMDLRTDSSAIDTLRRARRLAVDTQHRLRLAVKDVWLNVKYGIPRDKKGLALSAMLADSLVENAVAVDEPSIGMLQSLAALTNNLPAARRLATAFARRAQLSNGLTVELLELATRFSSYAAIGTSADTLRSLERYLLSRIRSSVPAEQQQALIDQFVLGSHILAFPVTMDSAAEAFNSPDDFLLRTEAALATGDARSARRSLSMEAGVRRTILPGDLTFDGVFPYCWLVSRLGGASTAYTCVSSALDGVRSQSIESLMEARNAGALIQTARLRASIAAAQGNKQEEDLWRDVIEKFTHRSRS